jgi:WD40 repeat protein
LNDSLKKGEGQYLPIMSHQTKDAFKAYYAQFMTEFEEELTGVAKTTTTLSNEYSLSSIGTPTKTSLDSESFHEKVPESPTSSTDKDIIRVAEKSDSSSQLPLSRSIELKGHTKPVSAVALDPSGTRMVTGSYDFTVKFWDFHGMDRDLRSFRTIEPWESYQVSLESARRPGNCIMIFLDIIDDNLPLHYPFLNFIPSSNSIIDSMS